MSEGYGSRYDAKLERRAERRATMLTNKDLALAEWREVALFLRNQVCCDDLHHELDQRHHTDPCPVEVWLDEKIKRARELEGEQPC
jgi:hypothetical protein